ncbi:MAG TPA: hypothetical protein ENI94_02390 [Gammaproteobacteria bacterium]|nr:hypothetical protein [Gammaproteobacteria bacterium]
MYKPWKPIERMLYTHPSIDWRVESRSVTVSWAEWFNNTCRFEMEITFKEGIAGIFCFDESTYQTTNAQCLPTDNEMDGTGFSSIPWPAWKSTLNYRKPIYGELGELIYSDVFSYFFVGGETVLLIDIADSEAIVDVKKA